MIVCNEKKKQSRIEELFRNPTSEYRGAPFWAWNTKLDKEQIKRQLPMFKEMGFGGYHVHPRTGLDTAYLSDEFFEMVKLCADFAKENGMKCYGYDEDRFPSGAAGGIVTENIKYRQRKLVWTVKYDENIAKTSPEDRAEDDYYLGKYVINLDDNGFITSYKRIDFNEDANGIIRYALIKIAEPEEWFNNKTYVDTMYKPAMDEFIKVTHEKYYEELGNYFGEIIPSFFTDEPKVAYKKVLSAPFDESDIVLPWTDDFPYTFNNKYGFDIVEFIPELYVELGENKLSKARYLYHRHIMERFTEAFSNNIGKWCDEHGVSLAGHMVKEPKLSSQSVSAGEVMAPLSAFGIPGIDMLCDAREYTTAKQAQSVKEQYGRDTMLSELYGVTNWVFDFRGHKLAGDWQAALGVNLRVPHLAWMSMKGEAKRDYPASIFYQSPWYKEYKVIEDHFARVNLAMSRGKRVCKVAMIHPVESCWNYWGVKSQTKDKLKQLDNAFKNITETLLFSQIDFDYISESLLPAQYGGVSENNSIKVGMAEYDVVIMAGCESIRGTTKKILDQWITEGGKVFVLNSYPIYMEGQYIVDNVDFNGAIFTNLSHEHLNTHKNMNSYFLCKAKLFEKINHNGLIVANSDDKESYRIPFYTDAKIVYYGFKYGDYVIKNYDIHENGSTFNILYKGYTLGEFKTSLFGKYNIYNCLAAIAYAYELGIPLKYIKKGINKVNNISGRFIKYTKNAITGIIDFAHTPNAIKNLLESIKLFAKGRIILVMGAQGEKDKSKRSKMGVNGVTLSDITIFTSEDPKNESLFGILND